MKAIAVFLLATGGFARAEDEPRMVWQGDVTGAAILYVRGDKVTGETAQGRARFRTALPDIRQDVKMQVLEGRGRVHIVEQPRADNEYTLAVAIDDRQSGASAYSLAFFWNAGPGVDKPKRSGRTDRLTWSGRVEGEVVVSCHARECAAAVNRGEPVLHEKVKFSRPMPEQATQVDVEDQQGRGEVLLMEQPRERNGYTARVLIRDPAPGAGDYKFTLAWTRVGGAGPGAAPEREPAERSLLWRGRVDGRVRVTVHGGAAFSEVVQGQPVSAERAEFLRPLPKRSGVEPRVRKMAGRGSVAVVESPSNSNRYHLVFEIEDGGPGADDYEIEVDW